MYQRSEIIRFLDQYLEVDQFSDNSWNGLQFSADPDANDRSVSKIALAVDAGLKVFDQVEDLGSHLLICHHGLFWKGANPSVTKFTGKRITKLSKIELDLYTVHLPLDAHPELGNNAQLLKLVGVSLKSQFAIHGGRPIGWIGTLAEPQARNELISRLTRELGDHTFNPQLHGKDKIESVAAISGGAGTGDILEAVELGVDLVIAGEAREVGHTLRDANANVVFLGHYNTETLGLKALATKLQGQFPELKIDFVDAPTGI